MRFANPVRADNGDDVGFDAAAHGETARETEGDAVGIADEEILQRGRAFGADHGFLGVGNGFVVDFGSLRGALRSADGRQVVVSYARPLGSFRGEVRLARITLR